MAIDTAQKRASAVQFKQIFRMTLPFPSGTVTLAQRLHLAYEYSNIQPGPPPTGGNNGIVPFPQTFDIFNAMGGIFNIKNSIMQV